MPSAVWKLHREAWNTSHREKKLFREETEIEDVDYDISLDGETKTLIWIWVYLTTNQFLYVHSKTAQVFFYACRAHYKENLTVNTKVLDMLMFFIALFIEFSTQPTFAK